MSGHATGTPRERILFLARAESRVRIMEALVESESATQRELRSQLDASRTTIWRSLRSLIDRDWVEKSDDGYRFTRAGHVIAEEFTRMLDTVDSIEGLEEFYRWFPAEVDAPNFLDANDVRVTSSTDADPYAPARKQSEILHTAERLRILLPATDLESTEFITEQVTQRGLEVETVVSPGVESVLESDEFVPLVREMLHSGHSNVFVAETDLPFYLGIANDGSVQVGLADEDGLPRVLLETTDADIGEWAERLYRNYRERARPKPDGEF